MALPRAGGRELILGIVFIVTAFFCVAVMSAFGKGAADFPTGQLVFFQSGISLVLFLPAVLKAGFRTFARSAFRSISFELLRDCFRKRCFLLR